jgi:hypothetical protein
MTFLPQAYKKFPIAARAQKRRIHQAEQAAAIEMP